MGEKLGNKSELSRQTRAVSQGFSGTVNMELTDLIQMLCLSRSDLIIRVRSSSGSGIIYVKEGQIHHAQTELLQGEAAFFEIIGWKDGHFEMIPFRDSGVQSVRKTWEYLLLEAMRLRDEAPEQSGGGSAEPDPKAGKAEEKEQEDFDDRIDQVFDELEQIAQTIMDDEPAEGPLQPEAIKTVKVLVVDDSPFFSKQIKRILDEDPGIEVIASAKNGQECLEFLSKHQEVDLITLDINMPVMPGDTALKHIMIRHPIPVLILSSLQAGSFDKLFEFLKLGAVDFAPKPSARDDIGEYGNRLRDMVKRSALAQISHFKRKRKGPQSEDRSGSVVPAPRIMLILGAEGASMDWFRLPLRKLVHGGLVIGLQKIPNEFLTEFCRLIRQETGTATVPIEAPNTPCTGRLNLGNARGSASLKLDLEPPFPGGPIHVLPGPFPGRKASFPGSISFPHRRDRT